MSALTKQQRELLGFIRAWQASEGTSPSFDEMREALALKSKSGVHRLIAALEERGFIRRIPNRARCIEVLDEPKIPETAALCNISTTQLAKELQRRGLKVGHIHRQTHRMGERASSTRTFVELHA